MPETQSQREKNDEAAKLLLKEVQDALGDKTDSWIMDCEVRLSPILAHLHLTHNVSILQISKVLLAYSKYYYTISLNMNEAKA